MILASNISNHFQNPFHAEQRGGVVHPTQFPICLVVLGNGSPCPLGLVGIAGPEAMEPVWEALELVWDALEPVWEALEPVWDALEPVWESWEPGL